MNRRFFFRTTVFAGAVLPFLSVAAGCREQRADEAAPTAPPGFSLEEITIEGLQEKMAGGVLTSEGVTRMYLDRIAQIGRNGPALNSVIELNPDSLAIAASMDAERRNGKVRGPLHGIPVLIKDNIDTADKMMTTAGSIALEGHYAKKDAFIVARLREAGAVIIGKTNLSEWANFRSTRSSSGWSSRGGQTKNPYAPDRNPCGSSSGSGVAVSANLCAAAIGTETNGSIACPSSINGIVGIKPTVGLWSRSGIIPISETQDTAGPMTRTVRDAAIILGLLAGRDPDDSATERAGGRVAGDYLAFADPNGLQGKRIGIERSFLKVHEAVDALLQKALQTMRNAGATVVEVDLLGELKIEGAEYSLLQFEFKDGINRYFQRSNTKVRSLRELIAFNRENDERAMPFFKQEILESSEEKPGLDSSEYREVLAKVLSVRKTIDKLLEGRNLDAICGPANGPAWCTDLVNGDFFTGYGMYSPAAMAGYPHITVPMGFVFGLPVGLTFLASAFEEGRLISIAYAYEQSSSNRVSPSFEKFAAK